MEPVAEPGDIADTRVAMALDDDTGRFFEVTVPPELGFDLEVQLHALLAGTAMDVVEHVDRRSHGTVDRHAARRRHPGDRDRRGLGPMVDRSHECCFE